MNQKPQLIGFHYSKGCITDRIGISLECDSRFPLPREEIFHFTIKTNKKTITIDANSNESRSTRDHSKKILSFDLTLDYKIHCYNKIKVFIQSPSGTNISYSAVCGSKIRDVIARRIKDSFIYRPIKKLLEKITAYLCDECSPIALVHSWNPETTQSIINKLTVYSKSIDIVLIQPSNLDDDRFNIIYNYSNDKNFKSLSKLSAPAVGRDIGGFISALLNLLETADRRPALLVHSKNTEFLPRCLSEDWRNSLIDPLISGMSGILALLKITFFGSALVCSKKNMRHDSPRSSEWKKLHPPQIESFNMARDLSLRIFQEKYDSFTYCAGTMMWVNPNKIRDVWTRERLVAFLGLLEPSENLTEPSHAHAFERLFPEALKRHGKTVSAV